MAKLMLIAGADLFSELQQEQALSLSTSSQQQSIRCPKHPMTLRLGVLTLPQHKMGPHCREHELGTQLGNDFSPIYSATWLSCRLSRLFSSLIFGASPAGVVWLTKGVKGSVFAYCTWMEWLACRQTRHFSPLPSEGTHPLVKSVWAQVRYTSILSLQHTSLGAFK